MSRLSEILGVPENVEFVYPGSDRKYMVNGMFLQSQDRQGIWMTVTGTTDIYRIIGQPDLIRLISSNESNLTNQQITAIKGRIAEGTPWAARGKDNYYPRFYKSKPINNNGSFIDVADYDYASALDNSFPFITFENSPVYLPDLIEGSEGE